MKKLARPTSIKKYNRLFKFLSFDLSLRSCIIIAAIIIFYMLVVAQLFSILQITEESSNIIS